MVVGRVALVGFVTLLLQVALFSDLNVSGGRPNLLLLFAIVAGMESDAERGAIAGFAAGLVFDLLLDTPAGLSALTLTFVGWGAGAAKDAVLRSSWVITVGLVAAASAVGTLLYAGLALVFGVTVEAGRLPAIVGIIAVVNALLSRPMRWALRWGFGPETRAVVRDRSIFRR